MVHSQLAQARSQDDFKLHRRLLGTILHRTIKRSGVPAKWFGAEISFIESAKGGMKIELQIAVLCDDYRLLSYLSALQADFYRRLLAVEADAHVWFAGVMWRLTCEPEFEVGIPGKGYWDAVASDRLAHAQERGAANWDREQLDRHFMETKPDDLVVDFSDTEPPQRAIEDTA